MSQTKYLTVFILLNLLNATQDYTKACLSKVQFTSKYGKRIEFDDITEGFNKKGMILGEGGFGKVKEMGYGDQALAVKKIKVVNANSRFLLSREIEFLNIMRNAGNLPGLPVYIDCMHTSTKGIKESKKNWFLYIFQEKLYKDLSDKNAALFRRVVPDKWHRLGRYQEFARGIRSLHSLNIVHSDIKPENLMSTENFTHFKLIDFGMSGFRGNKLIGGTKSFYPPEKLDGTSNTQWRTHDIWAYGLSVAMIESSFGTIMKGCNNSDFSNRGLANSCMNNILTNINNVLGHVYGPDMRDEDGLCINFTCVIIKCLSINAADRPDADDIVQVIHKFFNQEQIRRDNIIKKKVVEKEIPAVNIVLEDEETSNVNKDSMIGDANIQADNNLDYNEKLRMIINKQLYEERDLELEKIDENIDNGMFLAVSPGEGNFNKINTKNPYLTLKKRII